MVYRLKIAKDGKGKLRRSFDCSKLERCILEKYEIAWEEIKIN